MHTGTQPMFCSFAHVLAFLYTRFSLHSSILFDLYCNAAVKSTPELCPLFRKFTPTYEQRTQFRRAFHSSIAIRVKQNFSGKIVHCVLYCHTVNTELYTNFKVKIWWVILVCHKMSTIYCDDSDSSDSDFTRSQFSSIDEQGI